MVGIRFTVASALLVCTLSLAAAEPELRTLTPDQRRRNLASIELIYTTVRDSHWDPKLGGADWAGARRRAIAQLPKTRNMSQFRVVAGEMLSTLRQSHFGIVPGELYRQIRPARRKAKSDAGAPVQEPPGGPELEGDEETREEIGITGIEPGIVDRRAVVVRVEPDSPAAAAGVRTGWWIDQIGQTSTKFLSELFASADLAEEQRLLQSTLEGQLAGTPGESIAITFTDGEARQHTLQVDRSEPRGELAGLGHMPQSRVWIESTRLNGPVGYIRFNLFMDPERLMPAFEKGIRGCLTCKGFIIDLRGNPGGIGAMSAGMAGWFVDEFRQRLGTLRAREYTWNFEIFPRPETFAGPLAILVDGGSASTSEIFAGGMQDLKRARIFGSRTAGAALPSTIIRLPNGDGLQFANATYTSFSGKTLEGSGVIPDVTVGHTREALLAGRDAMIDAALSWILEQK